MSRPPVLHAVVLIAILSAACGPTAAPATTAAPAHATAGATPAATGTGQARTPSSTMPSPPPPSPAPSAPSPPTQSDSAWGRLWDALPAEFPVPPGAVAAGVGPADPVSAAFDLTTPPAELATRMQAALERANFSTLSLSGPLEDGTIIIDSVGPTTTDCRVETTITPRGGLTQLLVRYGADCPFE